MFTLRISLFFVVMSLFLNACVTIHIHFPAAAAEQVADKVVTEVMGAAQFGIKAVSSNPQLNISTDVIQGLRTNMKERHKKLKPFYDEGVIGLTNDGLIALRDANVVPLRSRNTVKGMVTEENQDRSAMYREIASANDHPEWETEIRKIFAKRWVEHALPKWWYQDKNGQWLQK